MGSDMLLYEEDIRRNNYPILLKENRELREIIATQSTGIVKLENRNTELSVLVEALKKRINELEKLNEVLFRWVPDNTLDLDNELEDL